MPQTSEIHFRRLESIEQGRSPEEYILEARMKRLPAAADNRPFEIIIQKLRSSRTLGRYWSLKVRKIEISRIFAIISEAK